MAFRSALCMLALAPAAANEFLQRAAAMANLTTTPQCESLSQTDPAKCPKVKGGDGVYINTKLTCVYNPGCKNGTVSHHCFQQTGCQYRATPVPAPAPTPVTGDRGEGETCGWMGAGQTAGYCQAGLMCYQPALPGFDGAPNYCVRVCNTDWSNPHSQDMACSSGTSCSCKAPLDGDKGCHPSDGDKGLPDGCYKFCSNPGSGDECFWPQVPSPTPVPAPAPTPVTGDRGEGETCGWMGAGQTAGYCQAGLMCYQPALPGFDGAPNYCVRVCNADWSDPKSQQTACSSGTSCSCYAPAPCSPPWDKANECYQWCSSPGGGDTCFWSQVQFGDRPR